MKFTLTLVFLCLIYLIPGNSWLKAQSFGRLNQDDGLSQGYINAIIQDQTGFLWFGTGDGLNRYDGYTFKVYYHDPNDSSSLSNNQITALAVAPDSCIWAGTCNGLNRYDPKTNKFTRYKLHSPNSTIAVNQCLSVDQEGLVWFSNFDDPYLICFDPVSEKTEFFSLYLDTKLIKTVSETKRGTLKLFATSIVINHMGSIWIGTSHGTLLHFDKKHKKISYTMLVADNDHVLSIVERDSLHLYVATGNRGCYIVDHKNKTSTPLLELHNPLLKNLLNGIYTLILDDKNNLIIGTKRKGLFRFDPGKKIVTQEFFPSPADNKIIEKGVYSLFVDKSGILWCGTNGYGIYYLSPYLDKFKTIDQKIRFNKTQLFDNGIEINANISHAGATTSLSFQSIRGIYANDDMILAGGYNGLDRIDRKTGSITNIDREIIPYVIIPDYNEPDKFVWIGTENYWKTLFRMNIQTNQLIIQPLDCDYIFSIYADKDHTLWIGTSTQLIKYNIKSGAAERYNHDPFNSTSLQAGAVKTIIRDHEGILWIGTTLGGVSCFDESEKRFKRYQYEENNTNSLNNNMVLCMHADSANRIWIATGGGGVNMLDYDRKKIIHFTTSDGLPNNFIYAILEDDQKMLWFSTNNGIFKLNPESLSVKIYSAEDGLQGNEFNSGSYFKDKHGELFFGGINGFSSFRPEKVTDNPYKPMIVLTSVKEVNETVTYNLPYHAIKELTFAYDNKVITLGFSALSFVKPSQNEYAYKLTGAGDEWINNGRNREISFHSLKPGRYQLEIKASNNDGVWCDSSLLLTLVITPPFWNTWWFYLCTFLFVIAVVLLYTRYRMYSIKRFNRSLTLQIQARTLEILQQKQEIEGQKETLEVINAELQIAKENAELANRAKSEFLTNISHEIRTPLNAVIGFSEILRSEVAEEKQRTYLDAIKIAGNSLLRLITDILDLSKIESGKFEVQNQTVNLVKTLKEVSAIFKQNVEDKNLRLLVEIEKDFPQHVLIDEIRMRQILLNLIGNSVKFTKRGYIRLGLKKGLCNSHHPNRINIIITVEDSGIGIPESELEGIFESFHQKSGQSNREYGGTGLGLAISKKLVEMMNGRIVVKSSPGLGSIFSLEFFDISLPVRDSLSEEQPEFDFTLYKFSPHRILIVGEDETTRLLLSDSLSKVGLFSTIAVSAQEALKKINEIPPDLILIDLLGEEGEGIEFINKLKENPKTSAIPIIVMTADTFLSADMIIPFNAIIFKPLDFNTLMMELSRFIPNEGDQKSSWSAKREMAIDPVLVIDPELAAYIDIQLAPLFDQLDRALIIENVKKIASVLQSSGNKFDSTLLINLGEELDRNVAGFDILKIKENLATISEMILTSKKK
ncbi:MAG: two-component regulator propeller domain-containing protein [Bacteroidales bacterium]|nr:two-component regulator propeller domain-containing protein [Bacteroidales bacterium]